jgi:hypothetical protein
MRALAGILALALPIAAAAPAAAADRALIVGLDRYADQRLNSKIGTPAANDAAAMRLLLTTKLGFTDKNVRILTDEAATADGIRQAIAEWLVAGSDAGERAYLYFGGLGYFAPDRSGEEADGLDEGLVPFDAKLSVADGKLSIDGLVTDDEIEALLEKLKDRSVTIVADAGFSGRVSRGNDEGAGADLLRAPPLPEATRAIAVEPKIVEQKSEGGFLEKLPESADVAVWTAVSASQAPLVDISDPKRAGGIFTRLYIEGIEGKADRNGNGKISNPELLGFLTEDSEGHCKSHAAACEMGLTPRLDPGPAHALGVLPEAAPAKAETITPDALTDFLAKGNTLGISLRQSPEGPRTVGDKDIRFHVKSPHDGFLILFNLTDGGELIQLFPNQFSRKHNRDGRLRAGAELMVPDDYYGLRFDATAPTSGQLVAIVTRDKIDLGETVATRAIEVIPRQEAVETVLPQIAAALGEPAANSNPDVNTKSAEWSVATLRYEIKPRP